MSSRYSDLASECERLAIRATDRSDGLVEIEGDAAMFLFDLASALRDADEVVRNAGPLAALRDAKSARQEATDAAQHARDAEGAASKLAQALR